MTFLDIFGYVASALVAVSLMMSNVLRLRIINTVGAFTFAVYGYLVGAYPVLAVNGWIFLVDLYYLYKMTGQKDFFKLLEGVEHDSTYLSNFIDFYRNDIERFFPDFKNVDLKNCEIVLILRNLVPAGVFVFRKDFENKAVIIELDYTIPDYRDMKNTTFLIFDKRESFRKNGFEIYKTSSFVKEHIKYLKKLGFKLADRSIGLYVKKIGE